MERHPIEANGHDLRKGFDQCTYSSDEEYRQLCREENYKADLARKRRLRAKSTKPRMSFVLIHTKIPQIFDKFIMPRAKRACALGALHIEAGANICSDEPSWSSMTRRFDVYDEEFYRNVRCIKCGAMNSLTSTIHHLNDVHKLSNKEIGIWLKKYDL